jgi:hypothetical protein
MKGKQNLIWVLTSFIVFVFSGCFKMKPKDFSYYFLYKNAIKNINENIVASDSDLGKDRLDKVTGLDIKFIEVGDFLYFCNSGFLWKFNTKNNSLEKTKLNFDYIYCLESVNNNYFYTIALKNKKLSISKIDFTKEILIDNIKLNLPKLRSIRDMEIDEEEKYLLVNARLDNKNGDSLYLMIDLANKNTKFSLKRRYFDMEIPNIDFVDKDRIIYQDKSDKVNIYNHKSKAIEEIFDYGYFAISPDKDKIAFTLYRQPHGMLLDEGIIYYLADKKQEKTGGVVAPIWVDNQKLAHFHAIQGGLFKSYMMFDFYIFNIINMKNGKIFDDFIYIAEENWPFLGIIFKKQTSETSKGI